MAINLTPIKKIINSLIDYKVYNGNHNLTPVDYQHGAVILWCTGSIPISTAAVERSFQPGETYITEITSMWNEYNIQLDILKTVNNEPARSQLVPFEMESYIIIDGLNSKAPQLKREHGLGLSKIRTRLWLEKVHNKPTHRLAAEFTILAKSEVRFKAALQQVECINPIQNPIKNK